MSNSLAMQVSSCFGGSSRPNFSLESSLPATGQGNAAGSASTHHFSSLRKNLSRKQSRTLYQKPKQLTKEKVFKVVFVNKMDLPCTFSKEIVLAEGFFTIKSNHLECEILSDLLTMLKNCDIHCNIIDLVILTNSSKTLSIPCTTSDFMWSLETIKKNVGQGKMYVMVAVFQDGRSSQLIEAIASETNKDAGYEQQLDKSVIKKIKDLIVSEGILNPKEIKTRLAAVREEILNCPTTNRRFNPTLDDIRNHMYIALKCGRYSANDQTNLQHKISEWKSVNPEDNYFFQPVSTSTNGIKNLLFVHQTAFQERLLNKYGNDIVLMDSTFKTTKYNLPLFFMAVLSNVGYMVVASFVTGHENTSEIEDALRILVKWNPQWRPNAFMTDLDQREISAIEHCFSGKFGFNSNGNKL